MCFTSGFTKEGTYSCKKSPNPTFAFPFSIQVVFLLQRWSCRRKDPQKQQKWPRFQNEHDSGPAIQNQLMPPHWLYAIFNHFCALATFVYFLLYFLHHFKISKRLVSSLFTHRFSLCIKVTVHLFVFTKDFQWTHLSGQFLARERQLSIIRLAKGYKYLRRNSFIVQSPFWVWARWKTWFFVPLSAGQLWSFRPNWLTEIWTKPMIVRKREKFVRKK